MSVISGLTGTLGGVVPGNPIGGIVKGAAGDVAGLGLNSISSWVLSGAKAALLQVADMIGAATTPNLQSTWFSSTYWRVAALAALLTVPFLCAAAVQALLRSDLALLGKVAFGYLPLSLIGVSLAAPLTMLLLAATDQMSKAVSASAVDGGPHFLEQAASAAGTISAVDGSPFFAVIIALFAVMAALALALELIVRSAAVYVVVLMLPLAFAALVWPARRIWAVRLVELLVSLILSKFVIIAVLSLAGAAFEAYSTGTSQLLTAMALLLLSTFAPWALMRLLPFTELAAGAAGMLRHEIPQAGTRAFASAPTADGVSEMAMSLPARMRSQAADVAGASTESPTPSRSGFGATAPDPQGGATPQPEGEASRAETTRDEFPGPMSTSQPAGTGAGTGTGPATSTGPATGTDPTTPTGTDPGTPTETGTGTATAAQNSNGAGRDRLPGMDPIWQAQNGEWGEIKRLDADFVRNGIDYSPPADQPEPEDEA